MKTAAIITRWQTTQDGDELLNIPALFRDIVPAVGDSYEDITEQPNLPPEPNLVVVRADVNSETLAKIKLDPRYGRGAVLWESGEDFDTPVSPCRLSQTIHHLATRIGNRYTYANEQWVQDHILPQPPTEMTLGNLLNAIIMYLRFHPSQKPLKE